MNNRNLEAIARSLVTKGKGILAADESFPTIQKRFDQIDVISTEETRRSYRELLFTTPGIEEFISGIILFDETIRQTTQDHTPFVELFHQKGIIPGIKVDKGAKSLDGFPGEKITEGLDHLRERLTEYRELGASFAKWRAVIIIGAQIPSGFCISANAHALARYAALCQEAGLVPVIEPEVLMDGNHDIQKCEEVTTSMLEHVFYELSNHRVLLEGLLLKPNMVIPGKESPQQASVSEVAEATLRCLRRSVPVAIPGIVFLSGGQSPELATLHLNAMNALGDHPWELSFSFGRALQQPALKTWKGRSENTKISQEAFYHRAKCNSAARFGKYSKEMEEMNTEFMVT
jgi:fructose-bisphosphate aldolase class I